MAGTEATEMETESRDPLGGQRLDFSTQKKADARGSREVSRVQSRMVARPIGHLDRRGP